MPPSMLNSRMAILALTVAVALSAHAVAEDSAQETLPSTMGEGGVVDLPDEGTPSVRDPNELDRDPIIKGAGTGQGASKTTEGAVGKIVLGEQAAVAAKAGTGTVLPIGAVVGLWNPTYKRFMRMPSGTYLDKSGVRNDGTLPGGWSWEKFKVVDAGGGNIGLWNPTHKRFMRMPSGTYLDKSGVRNDGTLPGGWSWEKFKVQCLEHCNEDPTPETPSPSAGEGSHAAFEQQMATALGGHNYQLHTGYEKGTLWGTPSRCLNENDFGSIGVNKCCKEMDAELFCNRRGLFADILLSVASLGKAKQWDGQNENTVTNLVGSKEAFKNGEPADYFGKLDSLQRVRVGARRRVAPMNGNLPGNRETNSGDKCPGDPRPSASAFSGHRSGHDSAILVLKTMSMSPALCLPFNQGFVAIWFSAVASAFPDSDWYEDSSAIDEGAEFQSEIQALRNHFIDAHSHWGNNILRDHYHPFKRPDTSLTGAPFLKGMEYRKVTNQENTITVHQKAGPNGVPSESGTQCYARIQWQMNICKGCSCTLPNGQKSLIQSHLDVQPGVGNDQSNCGPWFIRVDQLFRQYFAGMRAAMLTKKSLCCDPEKGSRFVDFDGAQCQGETFPTNVQALSAPTPPSAPTDMTDETASEISKMELSCKYHAQVERDMTYGNAWSDASGPNARDAPDAGNSGLSKTFGNFMKNNFVLSGKMVCQEDNYAGCTEADYAADGCEKGRAARNAFGQMGLNYFPPQIAKVTSHELELSCGGGHTASFFQYTKGGFSKWGEKEEQAQSYEGENVLHSLAAFKMDGGYGDVCKSFAGKDGRCGQGPTGNVITYDDGRRCNTQKGSTLGTFRPRNGGETNSCCAPFGREPPLMATASASQQIDTKGVGRCPAPNDLPGWQDIGLPDRLTCYRAVYGMANGDGTASDSSNYPFEDAIERTQGCKSRLRLKIYKCNGCGCNELVKFHIDHGLTEPSGGGTCRPWFTQADAGVRAWIAYWRAQINKEKAAACGYA